VHALSFPVRLAAAGSLAVAAVLLAGCGGGGSAPAAPAPLLELDQVWAGKPFALNEAVTTPAGEEFTATRFRYYLSGFRLRRADGTWFEPKTDAQSSDGYFLIDAAEPASAKFALPAAPVGEYSGLEFRVGIDDVRNHAGAQTGALDPAKGMFWTWTTGYIHFKLEGRSPASPEPEQRVTLHVGGDGLSRTIFLPFATKPLKVAEGLQPTVHVVVDVASFFGGEAPLKFGETHNVMDGPHAAPLADRYAGLFRVDHLHHEPAAARP